MAKKTFSMLGLLALSLLFTGFLTAAAPAPLPNATFTLISPLPETMNVGDTATATVLVNSDQEFTFAQMLPSFYYPGRYVLSTNTGGDRVHAGTTATLEITFTAKSSTASLPNGVAPVAVVAGVHYQGGYTVYQRYEFDVAVP